MIIKTLHITVVIKKLHITVVIKTLHITVVIKTLHITVVVLCGSLFITLIVLCYDMLHSSMYLCCTVTVVVLLYSLTSEVLHGPLLYLIVKSGQVALFDLLQTYYIQHEYMYIKSSIQYIQNQKFNCWHYLVVSSQTL